ncbi:hypothetical protein V8C86DRAFT_1335121 [Haematococcus lacustris]
MMMPWPCPLTWSTLPPAQGQPTLLTPSARRVRKIKSASENVTGAWRGKGVQPGAQTGKGTGTGTSSGKAIRSGTKTDTETASGWVNTQRINTPMPVCWHVCCMCCLNKRVMLLIPAGRPLACHGHARHEGMLGGS